MQRQSFTGSKFTRFGFTALILAVAFSVLSSSTVAQVIYDNGPFITGAVSKNGTAAPAGKQWSEVQNDNGNTTESNTLAASGCQAVSGGNNRCADDFVVPVGETWTINSVTVYIIQVGATTNPVNNMNLRFWTGGRPADPGATIVFGDTTTNRFTSSTDTNVLRIFNSAVPTSNTPRTDLIVWEVKIAVNPGVVLTAGTYWIDYQTTATAAQFSPLVTYNGARYTPLNNARQFTSSTNAWANVIDAGNPAGAPDVPLDIPFKLEGTRAGAPAIPRTRLLDFDGDNISDYAIVRSFAVGQRSDWWIRGSGGTNSVIPLGAGVGLSGGDRSTPADFDGDGKTDAAVWQSGAPGVAAFHIIQSSTGTLRSELFGQTNDDPSIVGDFDGDGKADPAVYRSGASGTFYYRGSLSNPGGATTAVAWGAAGDNALAGDFDGDGKRDFAIVRESGGLATHWRLMATGSTQTFQYGLATDRFVTGDFDKDNRTDTVALRASGSVFTWFLLKSSDSTIVIENYGNPTTDYPITGDYDGDGRNDFGVWRSGSGTDNGYFFIRNSNSARTFTKWGSSSANLASPDYPVANFTVKTVN